MADWNCDAMILLFIDGDFGSRPQFNLDKNAMVGELFNLVFSNQTTRDLIRMTESQCLDNVPFLLRSGCPVMTHILAIYVLTESHFSQYNFMLKVCQVMRPNPDWIKVSTSFKSSRRK